MVTVAIAVNGGDGVDGKGSRRAVRWALDHLLPQANRLLLVHVMPPVTSIPTPSGELIPMEEVEERVVELYVKEVKSKFAGVFVPYRKILRAKTQMVETLILEGENPAISLLEFIVRSRIDALVLGSCSPNCISRKIRGPGVPTTVLIRASETCDIYVVFKHKTVRKSAKPSLVTAEFRDEGTSSLSQEESGQRSSPVKSEVQKAPSLSVDSLPNPHYSGDDLQLIATSRFSSTASIKSDLSDVQDEVDKLRMELQNIIARNRKSCEDLILTQNKVELLSSECLEEQRRLNAAHKREESLIKLAAEERARYLQAVKEIEEAKILLSKEAHERKKAEMNALKESSEKQKIFNTLFVSDRRYKRYTQEEIEVATNCFSDSLVIGEGGYGKVYICNLDHTPVAVKVLRADAVQKRDEFLKEIEVLSQLHHPHLVLLLGACPESGCLVYEYLENGSLDDCIFHRNGKPPLPWFMRFRIIFEVACGLAFLHNSKPEPVVHRDLKPGNILLDQNYVSKIADVGLAKLVSDVVPDNVTEYRDSMLAGTFYYMDPEYQRTGTIRPKSDLYAFGIVVLQILTARRPNGLILTVENAIKNGSFTEILDKSITNWPLTETKELAQMALECSKLRCRDRPDLDTKVLPSLQKLLDVVTASTKLKRSNIYAPSHYFCPILKEIMDEPYIAADGFTYEWRAIKAWLEKHSVSPVTKLKLNSSTLTPNHALYSAIREWRSRVNF